MFFPEARCEGGHRPKGVRGNQGFQDDAERRATRQRQLNAGLKRSEAAAHPPTAAGAKLAAFTPRHFLAKPHVLFYLRSHDNERNAKAEF